MFKKVPLYISLFLIIAFISCNKKDTQISIRGNYTNLPDGIMYLCQDNDLNKIDSVKTIKGKFNFSYRIKNKKNEPIYLSLHHIDRKGMFRFISFTTDAKYRDGKWFAPTFLSDSIITINGKLKEINPVGIKFDGKTIFTEAPKLNAGPQTDAMYHINGDLFDYINKDTYNKVLSKIKEYPYSFHLLYQINNKRNSFTSLQVKSFLSVFRGEIIKSETFKTLSDYNAKRLEKNKTSLPLLLDNLGKKEAILNPKYKKHLVIFWASWCGPCRQEIPSLKKMYPKYKNDIEFVSISIDEKNSLWQKALVKEQMPWKQFIVNENSKEYKPIEICFQVSNSIPYVALIDNNMKVLKSTVGSMTEKELEDFLKD